MSDPRSIPTPREVSALCATVRDGRLDDEQRERLAQLLDTIGSAVRVAPTVAARYPGQPERAAAAELGCWGTRCPALTRRCSR
jgi:LDH2 family malate/lactate/ureidoglycolate dehydrogenase